MSAHSLEHSVLGCPGDCEGIIKCVMCGEPLPQPAKTDVCDDDDCQEEFAVASVRNPISKAPLTAPGSWIGKAFGEPEPD